MANYKTANPDNSMSGTSNTPAKEEKETPKEEKGTPTESSWWKQFLSSTSLLDFNNTLPGTFGKPGTMDKPKATVNPETTKSETTVKPELYDPFGRRVPNYRTAEILTSSSSNKSNP